MEVMEAGKVRDLLIDCRTELAPAESSSAIAMLKSAIGDCVDQQPHDAIRAKLWQAVEIIYRLRAQAETALNRKQIMEILYHGRTMVNFHHVPEVTRAIDWLSQEFADALAADTRLGR
jgi:uncharacterized protein with PhoU and TrkA domain